MRVSVRARRVREKMRERKAPRHVWADIRIQDRHKVVPRWNTTKQTRAVGRLPLASHPRFTVQTQTSWYVIIVGIYSFCKRRRQCTLQVLDVFFPPADQWPHVFPRTCQDMHIHISPVTQCIRYSCHETREVTWGGVVESRSGLVNGQVFPWCFTCVWVCRYYTTLWWHMSTILEGTTLWHGKLTSVTSCLRLFSGLSLLFFSFSIVTREFVCFWLRLTMSYDLPPTPETLWKKFIISVKNWRNNFTATLHVVQLLVY